MTNPESDAAVLDRVEARLLRGVTREREMTRDEGLAVFRMAILYRNSAAAMLMRLAELEAALADDRDYTDDGRPGDCAGPYTEGDGRGDIAGVDLPWPDI